MWELPKGSMFLRGVPVRKLKKFYEKEKNPKAKVRLLAAIKRKEEMSVDDIAISLHLPKRTVHGWLWKLVKEGLNGIYDKKQTGRPAKLTKKDMKKLRDELVKGPKACGFSSELWTMKMIREHVKRKFGAEFVSRHTSRIMNKIDFTYRKPRIKHYKSADKRSQERFKKRFVKR